MSGIEDLATLLREMRPVLLGGEFAFCLAPGADIAAYLHLEPLAFFREAEGLSLILPLDRAAQGGLSHSAPVRAITLTVHSSLEAVGLTAAVATTLAASGISANVVAAYTHDHIFVPADRAEAALAALLALQADATPALS